MKHSDLYEHWGSWGLETREDRSSMEFDEVVVCLTEDNLTTIVAKMNDIMDQLKDLRSESENNCSDFENGPSN